MQEVQVIEAERQKESSYYYSQDSDAHGIAGKFAK